MEIGQPIPNLLLPTTNSGTLTLADLKGKNVILYFYPKDCTSGCTQQARDFRDQHAEFQRLNTVILGISRDKVSLHQKFIKQENLPFELVPDTEKELCELFQVIKPKTMYGKPVTGIERSTFLIDQQGILRQVWRKVKVNNHAAEVLAAVKALSQKDEHG